MPTAKELHHHLDSLLAAANLLESRGETDLRKKTFGAISDFRQFIEAGAHTEAQRLEALTLFLENESYLSNEYWLRLKEIAEERWAIAEMKDAGPAAKVAGDFLEMVSSMGHKHKF